MNRIPLKGAALLCLIFLLSGCGNTLTVSALEKLAQKGKDLSWEDFEKYSGTETGSGLYILL